MVSPSLSINISNKDETENPSILSEIISLKIK